MIPGRRTAVWRGEGSPIQVVALVKTPVPQRVGQKFGIPHHQPWAKGSVSLTSGCMGSDADAAATG